MSNILSKKDNDRREFVLKGNMWKVVLSISIPLAIYSGLDSLFGFIDTLMASQIGSEVVSAVAYLSQIKSAIGAIGAGLAVGGGIIIARHFGAGDIEKAKKNVSTLLFLAISIGLLILVFIVPFTKPILRLINTPEDLINVGGTYFAIEIIMIVSIFINNVYIAIERAKGNSKKVLYLNLMVVGIKLPLTALFVYVFKFGITMMAVATLVAHLSLTIIGVWDMLRPRNVFRLSFKNLELSTAIIWPIVALALPIFFEKFAFSFGKVLVNSMSVLYGSAVVGALGVSNKIGAIVTGMTLGFQDGEASIISQNLGNVNLERAIDAFKKTLTITLILGTVGVVFIGVFLDPIITLFTQGDMEFARVVKGIARYERYGILPLIFTTAVMGFLYGFGYTKLSLGINFARLFVFRIPTLYIMQSYTNLGSESIGVAMMVSNCLVGVTAGIVYLFVIKNLKNKSVVEISKICA